MAGRFGGIGVLDALAELTEDAALLHLRMEEADRESGTSKCSGLGLYKEDSTTYVGHNQPGLEKIGEASEMAMLGVLGEFLECRRGALNSGDSCWKVEGDMLIT